MRRVSVKKAVVLGAALLVTAGPLAGLGKAAPEVAADAPVSWAPAPNSIVNPSVNSDGAAWVPFRTRPVRPSVDERLDDPVLHGAIDVHAHLAPDSYARLADAFEIAKLAHERGLRGIVLKNHWTETAGTAWLVRKYAGAPGLEVFGGLSLNVPVGGINPQAVRYFAEVEGRHGRIVWMPTHDAETEVKFHKSSHPYVVVSKDGKLLPSVLEVLDLIAHYDLTLATGHVYAEEMVQIVAEAKKRGIDRIIITHPAMGPMYTNPTIDQLREVVGHGAYVEVVASALINPDFRQNSISLIRTLGPEHFIVSSDAGLAGWYNHTDALVHAARFLREAGFGEDDLNLMFKDNPAKVLGLPVRQG
jgi:hypothetical protein